MCELYIQADHLYYEQWGSSIDTVIEQITAHVEAVNSIYEVTGNRPGVYPVTLAALFKDAKCKYHLHH